jgi:hypothetical protein
MPPTATSASNPFEAGFAREIITPPRGLALAGYFNDRPNRGMLDQLYVKAALFRQGRTICGVVSLDLVFVSADMVDAIRAMMRGWGECYDFVENLLFCATHVHTGPYTSTFASGSADPAYLRMLETKAAGAIGLACASFHPVTLGRASVSGNPYAFNRRYWMRNGTVMTNPPRRDPDIVKPEGPVDPEISVLAVLDNGRVEGLLVNLSNHTDTIGLDLVSADWPGQMEKEIQRALGYEAQVMTLIAPSGNVNHFNHAARRNQTCYGEAARIGKGYARIVLERLTALRPLAGAALSVRRSATTMPYRKLRREDIEKARGILKKKIVPKKGSLTSEDLARGDETAARYFADQLVRFHKASAGKKAKLEFLGIRFGRDLAIASLPGEPFTEIGLAIKKRSPYKQTLVVSNAQDSCGYVPLKECFARGGYEPLPVLGGGLDENAAPVFIEQALKTLK